MSTTCSRRVRSAAGLSECISPPRERCSGRPEPVRAAGEGCYSSSYSASASTSGSNSGTNSDEEFDAPYGVGLALSRLSLPARDTGGPGKPDGAGIRSVAGLAYAPSQSGPAPLSRTSSLGSAGLTCTAPKCLQQGSIRNDTARQPITHGIVAPHHQQLSHHTDLVRVDSQVLLKGAGDSIVTFSSAQMGDLSLGPDLPLIYFACITTLVLVYFVVCVDCKTVARSLFPVMVEEFHWHSLEKLEMGLNVGAAILLAFFVWLLHALLYDVAGMVVGLLPSLTTFSSVFSYRVLHHTPGYLVLALVSVACGFAGARALEDHMRRQSKRQSAYLQ